MAKFDLTGLSDADIREASHRLNRWLANHPGITIKAATAIALETVRAQAAVSAPLIAAIERIVDAFGHQCAGDALGELPCDGLVTHKTMWNWNLERFLCDEHAAQQRELNRRAKSKGSGVQPPVTTFDEHPAIVAARSALKAAKGDA